MRWRRWLPSSPEPYVSSKQLGNVTAFFPTIIKLPPLPFSKEGACSRLAFPARPATPEQEQHGAGPPSNPYATLATIACKSSFGTSAAFIASSEFHFSAATSW
jgi:hypothetical protein